MSEENLDVVRSVIDAYNRGDVDGLLGCYDPEVELVTLLLGHYSGKDALRQVIAENEQNLPGYGYELDELIDAGNTVIVVVRLGGAGRVSQIELGDPIAFTATIRDGLIVRQETFRNKAEAIEAAERS